MTATAMRASRLSFALLRFISLTEYRNRLSKEVPHRFPTGSQVGFLSS